MTKTTSRDLRIQNRSLILEEFYFHGPISRLEVSRRIGLSPATVTKIVTQLIDSSILIQTGQVESNGGRPSVLLRVNPQLGYIIGIELGETYVRAKLFDINLKSIDQHTITISTQDASVELILESLETTVEELVSKSIGSWTAIMGIAIGIPGLVDPKSGVSIFAPNWQWSDVPLGDLLRNKFEVPVYLDNGAKAMGLAEMLFGNGRGKDDVAVLLVGTGVGGAFIQQSVLYRGTTNSAGEIGHMSIDFQGPLCRCGNKGCLEAFVGAEAIIANYRKHKTGPSDLPNGQIDVIKEIIKRFREKDPAAEKVIDEAATHLAAGMGNIINLLNPERIILGGWLGLLLGDLALPLIDARISAFSLPQPRKETDLRLSDLGEEAIPRGAATLILMDFFKKPDEMIPSFDMPS